MKRPDFRLDVVHANYQGNIKVSPTAKCPVCPNKIRNNDAVLRIRNFEDISADPITIHRRCIEKLLVDGVEDVPKELSKFEKYRAKLAEGMNRA